MQSIIKTKEVVQLTDKKQKTAYLDYHLCKKMERISHINDWSESQFIENALNFYIENSKVVKEAQKKIVEYDSYLKSVGRTAVREISYGNSEGIEYRPQHKGRDD
jgi:hypothetical protein